MAVTINSEMPSHTSELMIDTNTFSFSFTNTAGTMLIVVTQTADDVAEGITVSGVTYNSVAMTLRVTSGWYTPASPTGQIKIWTLSSPATGSNTLAITASAVIRFHVAALSVTGESGAIGVTNTNNNDTSNTSHALTLSGTTSGSLCVLAAGCGASITSRTQTLSSALNNSTSFSSDNSTVDRAAGTGGDVTDTWGSGGDVWGSAGIEILPIGGGGGAKKRMLAGLLAQRALRV